MPNPFLHISKFGIRSYIHTPTSHIHTSEFLDQHASAVVIRCHGYEQHYQSKN